LNEELRIEQMIFTSEGETSQHFYHLS